MENGRTIESVDGEILLPEAIIQLIQSFLSGKLAAQTSILSKSWYSAWSTRPDLDFHQVDFRTRGYEDPKSKITDPFLEFVKETVQRYQKLNLKIESFRLWMTSHDTDGYSLVKELIVKAIKIGARYFSLGFMSAAFVLPHEVLGSETLISLSMNGGKIDLGTDGKVSCSKLKSLSLCNVYIEGDIIRDIISSCPLIERLILSECMCLFKVQSFNVVRTINRMLTLSPFIEFGKQNVGSVFDGRIHLHGLHNLKYLVLDKVSINSLFFRDISSKFPCLKDLTLDNCDGHKGIGVSSRSLECIRFIDNKMSRARFDVPSIREFDFEGSDLPSLIFKTASREWVSHITITSYQRSTSLFFKLKKFLKKLSPSKISLSLVGVFLEKSFDYTKDVIGLPKPVVENLKLFLYPGSSDCSAILGGLFWSCRPKFITLDLWPKSCIIGKASIDFLELLFKTLNEVRENCCIPNLNKLGLCDLEEVNVEILENSQWRPLPWNALLDDSTSQKNKRIIRLQLRWGLESIHSNNRSFLLLLFFLLFLHFCHIN